MGVLGSIGDAYNAAKNTVSDAADTVSETVSDGVDAVGDAVDGAVEAGSELLSDGVGAAEELAEAAETQYGQFFHDARGLADRLRTGSNELGEGARDWLERGGQAVQEAAEDVRGAVESVGREVGDTAGEALDGFVDRARTAGEELVQGARDGAREVVEGASEAIHAAGEGAKGILDRVGEGVDEAVDVGRRAAEAIRDFGGEALEALNPFEGPDTAIDNLDSDGDTFNIKLGGEISLAPHEAAGLAGIGGTLKGDVAAQVKQVGDPPNESFELELSGHLEGGVTGEVGVDPIADAEGHIRAQGTAKLKFKFATKAEAREALAEIAAGRVPEGVDSIELRGGIAVEISEQVGLPWAVGERAGARIDEEVGVRLELNPPAVAVLGEMKGKIDGAAAVGLHVSGQVDASVALEAKVSLPEGTTIQNVLENPAEALRGIDRNALQVQGTFKLRGEAGAGPLGRLYGAGAEVEFKVKGRPGDLLTAGQRFVSGDVTGTLDAFSAENEVSGRADVFYQKGPRYNVGAEVEGVGGGVTAEWYREDHASVQGDLDLQELRRYLTGG